MNKGVEKMLEDEISSGDRFEFGKNWSKFLTSLTDAEIENAKKSLIQSLQLSDLRGYTFLDAGSGSGLFSLAAFELGATVTSFDYDPDCVQCTTNLCNRYCKDTAKWSVLHGSVLDKNFLSGLGKFDIIYSWGVLHHTGSMWEAMDNLVLLKPQYFYVAIYNDQGFKSWYWSVVKKLFNTHFILRCGIILIHFPYLYLFRKIKTLFFGDHTYRGMNLWTDMIDWLGGLPFEVATPHDIVKFNYERNFLCGCIKTVGNKLGCNEFLFVSK